MDTSGQIFDHLTKNFIKLLKVDFVNDSFEILKDQYGDIENEPGYNPLSFSAFVRGFAIEGMVHRDDMSTYLIRTDRDFLLNYFARNDAPLNISYRRKKKQGFFWVVMEITKLGEWTNSKKEALVAVKEKNDYFAALQTIVNSYISVHIIDIKNNTFRPIKTNQAIDVNIAAVTGGIEEKMKHALNVLTHEQDREGISEFVDFSTLETRLQENPSIHYTFLGNISGWCKATFSVMDYREDGTPNRVIFSVESVDEAKKREDRLKKMAQTDLLTGILNRGSGQRAIEEMVAAGEVGMFCLFDIDKFKHINDTYGHAAGDKALIEVASVMKNISRAGDIVMRFGGDEFALFVKGVTDQLTGSMIIYRLFDAIESIHIKELGEEKITISLGAAFYKEHSGFNNIYRKTDKAVYESKGAAGNQLTFAD